MAPRQTSRLRLTCLALGAAALCAVAAAAAGCGGETAATAQTAAAPQSASAATPPPKPPGDSGSGGATSASSTETATYTLNKGAVTKARKTFAATRQDRSAVRVTGGVLTLKQCLVKKTGETSSLDDSSFYGLNAAVLVKAGGTARLNGATVTAKASGANGVFATGAGAKVLLVGGKITAVGKGAHGIDATLGGKITAKNVRIVTTGVNSAALATDRGSGTIVVKGGTMRTSGADSPGIYSTGVFTITGATISSTGAEAAVIEGSNSITLTDTDLSTSMAGKWGVMIYQSMSGDAAGAQGTFTVGGGSLTSSASDGPLFYVTNSAGVIKLEGVDVTAASGTLVDAAAGRWGASGSNGGTAQLTAVAQALTGDLVADKLSSVSLSLTDGSTLTGAVDADDSAGSATLSLDATSTWSVTSDSHLTGLSDAAGISGTTIANITGNGHTVTYDPATCPSLGGKTYTLQGGGTLKPAS
jgi:hypothetical protein